MSRTRLFSRILLPILAGAVLLGEPVDSHAHRMLEGPNGGRTTRGREVLCSNENGFAHWNVRYLGWYLNPAGQGSGKTARLQAAVAAWSKANILETNYQLVYLGSTSAGVARDYRNTFVWGTTSAADLCNTTPCHAITVLNLDAGRVIRDADIVFNDTMDWRTDDSVTSACSAADAGMPLDTQAIATHELGHSLGIHHPQGSQTVEPFKSATMGAQSCNVAGRSLSTDDQEALRCSEDRYPVSPAFEGALYTANCDTISGWAWNANRPGRDAYVDLWNFVDPIDGNPLVGVIATKQVDGYAFSIPTPDDYKSGKWTSVFAKFSATSTNLSSSPISVACNVPLFAAEPGTGDHVSNNGGSLEVGVQFTAAHAGRIRALQYDFPPEEYGTRTISLWTDSGTLLASRSIKPPPYGLPGRQTAPLSSFVQIQAGTRYRVSVTTISAHSETVCSSSAPKSLYYPITNGPLTAHQSFWGAAGVFPTLSSCNNLWVGVVFDKN